MKRGAPPPAVQGKVLGFRVWTLRGHELASALPQLRSTWTLGPNTAVCHVDRFLKAYPGVRVSTDPHAAPGHGCKCGLYATHGPLAALSGLKVVGAVLAWGRIEVHHDGFRAEHAEPIMLAYHHDQPFDHVQRLHAVASEFDIPVVPVGELEREARLTGHRTIPHAHRPPPQPDESVQQMQRAALAFQRAAQRSAAQGRPLTIALRRLGEALDPARARRRRRCRRLWMGLVSVQIASALANGALFATVGHWFSAAAAAVCTAGVGFSASQVRRWRT